MTSEAYTEFWKRLHANGGKNTCADLFGGIKKAEKALTETTYEFGDTSAGTEAETEGKKIKFKPKGMFTSMSGHEQIQVGFNLRANQGYFVALNNIEAAAFILAHEIGHRTKTLAQDGHDTTNLASVINNGKLQEACFADLPTVVGPAVSAGK